MTDKNIYETPPSIYNKTEALLPWPPTKAMLDAGSKVSSLIDTTLAYTIFQVMAEAGHKEIFMRLSLDERKKIIDPYIEKWEKLRSQK